MAPLNINKMAKELDDKGEELKSSDSLLLPKAQQSSPADSEHAQSTTDIQGASSSPESDSTGELSSATASTAAAAMATVSGVVGGTTLEDLPEEPEDQSENSGSGVIGSVAKDEEREEEEVSDEEGKGEERGLVPKKPSLTVLPKRPRSQTAPVPWSHAQPNYQEPTEDNQDDSGEDEDEDDDEYNDRWDPDDLDLGPDDIPEPPDGGWGWVIVAASFLCNVVVDGIAYSFGILFMEFVNFYGAPKGKTAWVGSLLSGCCLSAGPLVSALTNRFGCRPVTIAGSIIACTAFLLSTIAPTVDILMITYGIMGGIGFGLIYLPAIVSVGYYFSTKRAFATGIAVCGSGVGAFVLAPACERFLDVYDWRGTVMILAGLALNCVVFGALMRPLEANSKSTKQVDRCNKPLLQRIAEEKERQRHASLCNSQFFLVQHADGTVEKRAKILLNTEPGVHSTLNLDQFGKSPAETPVVTLSPIEEVRKSPAGSRDEESSSEEKLAQQRVTPSESTPALSVVAPSPLPSIVLPPTTPAVQTPVVDASTSHPFNSSVGIREIARRKGVINSHGRMKMSVSNITVNSELHHRKTSVPNSVHLSASGSYLFPGRRNNNYLVEEVWKKLQREESQVPLDGSRPVIKKPTKKDFARPMYRKDIFYSGSIRNLPEYNSSKDLKSYVTSVISIPRDAADVPAGIPDATDGERPMSVATAAGPARDTGCCAPCTGWIPKSFSDTMKETLNFSLLKDPVFLLICIANIFGMLGFYIPYVYITDSSVMKGIPSDQAAFLLSIIGITNTVGRLFFGWVSDRPSVDALLLNNVSLTFCGFCILAIPFCESYTSLVIDCTLFGLFVSAYICLTSIILVDLLGLDRLTNAFGILSLFRGSASILGPPIAGSIYDLTGSYDLPFFISGSLLVFSASLSFMVPCVQRYVERKRVRNAALDDPEEGDNEEGPSLRVNGCERNGKRKTSVEEKIANQHVSVV